MLEQVNLHNSQVSIVRSIGLQCGFKWKEFMLEIWALESWQFVTFGFNIAGETGNVRIGTQKGYPPLESTNQMELMENEENQSGFMELPEFN